jgi:septal ring factor EnvC (AmiA/AmiB activator)
LQLEIAISKLKEELSCAHEHLTQSQAENYRLDQALSYIRSEQESSTFENSNLRNELLSSQIRIAKAIQALEVTAVKTATESPEDLQMED